MRHGERWLEASYRNRESRVRINAYGDCHATYPCEQVCIELRPNGWRKCRPPVKYDACGCEIEQTCPDKFMKVCSSYIDERGLHVFVWPKEVLTAKAGFYLGFLIANGCDNIGTLPVRVGAHPGAYYAEGPLHTNVIDCVACDDDEIGPCGPVSSDCGCDTETDEAYLPDGV